MRLLPWGGAQQLVVECQMIRPENIQRSNIIWTQQVMLLNMYAYIHAITITEKGMCLKDYRKEYMGGLDGGKEKEMCCN